MRTQYVYDAIYIADVLTLLIIARDVFELPKTFIK